MVTALFFGKTQKIKRQSIFSIGRQLLKTSFRKDCDYKKIPKSANLETNFV